MSGSSGMTTSLQCAGAGSQPRGSRGILYRTKFCNDLLKGGNPARSRTTSSRVSPWQTKELGFDSYLPQRGLNRSVRLVGGEKNFRRIVHPQRRQVHQVEVLVRQ